MSFLAQLRQRSDAVGDGTRLCYLLQPKGEPPILHLSLRLASVRGDRMEGSAKDYVIEQAHLRSPPPFLREGDVKALARLVQIAPGWLSRHAGELPGGWSFLSTLLATQGCFFGQPGQPPCRVRAGEPVRGGLQWIIDVAGRRHLDWRSAGTVLALAEGKDLCVYQPASNSLVALQHGLSEAALQTANPWMRPHPSEAVDAVLEDARRWASLGLPLPERLAVRKIEAAPVPVLVCDRPAQTMQPQLRLQFQYSNEQCCAIFGPQTAADEFRYRDGVQLAEFERDFGAEAPGRFEGPELREPTGTRADDRNPHRHRLLMRHPGASGP